MNLKRIPFGNLGKINVVVEIPKGSSIKIEYDEKMRAPVAKFFFRDGLRLPYNYGLIPETSAEDRDHLDVILLCEESIPHGVVVPSIPIGVLKLLDRGVPDHKIVAVPEKHWISTVWTDIERVDPNLRNEIVIILYKFAEQKKKTIEIQGFFGKREAEREIEGAHQRFEREKGVKFF